LLPPSLARHFQYLLCRHHVLDDAEIWEAFAEDREGLLERVDELGGRFAWEEFIAWGGSIDNLLRPVEAPVEMIS
jgi:hypothetical protein